MLEKAKGYALIGAVAVAAYFTGAVTDVGGAFQLFLDKEQAKSYCAQIIDGEETATPTETEVTE